MHEIKHKDVTRSLEDILRIGVNDIFLMQIEQLDMEKKSCVMNVIEKHISTICHPNGHKIKESGLKNMTLVYAALISYLNSKKTSENYGQCSPSLVSIVKRIYPDANMDKKQFHAAKMRVWRAVHALEKCGLIKIHTYRAETNQDKAKEPNFFYEFTPLREVNDEINELFNKLNKVNDTLAKPIETKSVKDFLKTAKEQTKTQIKKAISSTKNRLLKVLFKFGYFNRLLGMGIDPYKMRSC